MLRVWGLVLLANLIGGAVIAFVISRLGPGLGVIEASTFGEMARQTSTGYIGFYTSKAT